ncbi:DNA cytosine methyltransferase [Micromonospora sp. RP3T]|uniref:DNA cytosine methyltransferase n=1 Tax=Micromonospora sp. RP3T TaxID=2135446 RepID=UPI003D721048
MATLTAGGVCAGFGGLEMAAALALGPLETAWHAEVDPDASTVLATRYPGVPNHKDITTVDWRKVEPVDVYCAGFPCQPVSAAGKQAGDADKRWLWPYVLTGIRTTRPATVVVENVANLVSIQRGRLFRIVLGDLRAAGYAVRWAIAGACTAGGCHHRHRVFILARYVGPAAPPATRVDMPKCINQAPDLLLPTPRGRDWKRGGKDGLEEALLPTPRARDSKGIDSNPRGGELNHAVSMLPTPRSSDDRRGAESLTGGRTARGHGGSLHDAVALLPTPRVSSTRTGRSAILNTRSSPSIDQALEIARGELPRELRSWDEAPPSWLPDGDSAAPLLPTPRASDTGTPGRRASEGFSPPLSQVIFELLPTPRASDGPKGGPNMRGSSGDLMLPSAVQPERWGRFAAAVARSATLFGAPPEPVEPSPRGGLRLAAPFPEWMMGLPSGWFTDLVERNAALRLAGNGVFPNQGGRVIGLLAADEETPTDLFGTLAAML